ncbi:MAG TPA: hypothetical protein VMR49_01070 [Candidatus Paceibacterota bacterium]|nr:hypothetical protein [Candidatus Paceibacterota bacterium]
MNRDQKPQNENKDKIDTSNQDVGKKNSALEERGIVSNSVSKEISSLDIKENKYSLDAIKKDIELKSEMIRNWAQKAGLIEGQDFLIEGSITNIETDTKSIAPHELRQFFVLVKEDNYKKFKEYILGEYSKERKEKNPNNPYGGPKLDYSWGGRFAVGWDGAVFDTGILSSVENMTANTYHDEFKKFFKQKTNFDLPTSEKLNLVLKEMSTKGLEIYKLALEKLKILRKESSFPEDGYGLIDEIERAIMILEDAKGGEAVIDLTEELKKVMPAKMRHYADLTYNAEDIKNLDRVADITGISIPKEARIDKIFDRYGFDRNKMEGICKDFSDYIMTKIELKK